jgi:hypothetical protein
LCGRKLTPGSTKKKTQFSHKASPRPLQAPCLATDGGRPEPPRLADVPVGIEKRPEYPLIDYTRARRKPGLTKRNPDPGDGKYF